MFVPALGHPRLALPDDIIIYMGAMNHVAMNQIERNDDFLQLRRRREIAGTAGWMLRSGYSALPAARIDYAGLFPPSLPGRWGWISYWG